MTLLAKARARTRARAMATSPGPLLNATTAWDLDILTARVPRPWARAKEKREQRSARTAKERATASRSVQVKAVGSSPTQALTKEAGAKAEGKTNAVRAATARETAKEAGAKEKVKESTA